MDYGGDYGGLRWGGGYYEARYVLLFVTNACTNSRYIRKPAAQHPWAHAWRPNELNPRAKAKGFSSSRPVIPNAHGPGVSIPAPTQC